MEAIIDSPQQSRPPLETRPRPWWVITALATFSLLCGLIVPLTFLLAGYRNPPGFPYIQKFADLPYGIVITLPMDWRYMQRAYLAKGFGLEYASPTAPERFMTAPETGAVIIIYSDYEKVDAFFPGLRDIVKIEEMEASHFNKVTVEAPVRLRLGDYPAAVEAFLYRESLNYLFNTGGKTKMMYHAIILRGEEIIHFAAICPPEEWLGFRPVFVSALESLKVTARKK
jgi:hypothetical protein